MRHPERIVTALIGALVLSLAAPSVVQAGEMGRTDIGLSFGQATEEDPAFDAGLESTEDESCQEADGMQPGLLQDQTDTGTEEAAAYEAEPEDPDGDTAPAVTSEEETAEDPSGEDGETDTDPEPEETSEEGTETAEDPSAEGETEDTDPETEETPEEGTEEDPSTEDETKDTDPETEGTDPETEEAAAEPEEEAAAEEEAAESEETAAAEPEEAPEKETLMAAARPKKTFIGSHTYLIYPDNTRYTGWYTFSNGKKVYCDPDKKGAFATGMKKIGSKTYMFSPKGYLYQNVVITHNRKKYHANKNGILKSGWYRLSKNYRMYFSPDDLAAVKGLVRVGKSTYIFDAKGRSRTVEGIRVVNGKKYYSRSTGSLKTGWVRKDDYTMYFDKKTFAARTGISKVAGKYYIFRKGGNLFGTPGTPVYKGKKYWIADDGSLQTGWLVTPYYKMYFRPDTFTAWVNTTQTIGNRIYRFDGNGAVSSEYDLFWKSAFGITRKNVVDYLNSHMDSLIGTPYGGSADDTPVPGRLMNCTGFVWYVLNAVSTGNSGLLPCSDMRRCPQYYSPTWDETLSHYGFARVFGGTGDALGASGQKYVFSDKASMLASGVLEKGDIIWIAGSADTHIGFFWGDAPGEDRFWHSKYAGSESTPVYRGSASGNRISGIEACGFPLSGGYVVFKLD